MHTLSLHDALPICWIDRFDADGQVATEVMPASTGYHVVLAFAELIRVTGV